MAMARRVLYVLLACFLLTASGVAPAAPPPEDVPTFEVRARVVSVGGEAPAGKNFSFRLGPGKVSAQVEGDAWSEWLVFARPEVDATLASYPAIYMAGYPVVTSLVVTGVVDPTIVEAELRFAPDGPVTALHGELFGPTLGILVWRDENRQPRAATMANYNRRYWQVLEGLEAPGGKRPQRFPIVDRFIGGDDDRRNWREGIENLSRAGFSVIMLPPSRPIRDLLLETGLRRTAWAVYNPPGYAFDYGPEVTPEAIHKWAQDQAKPYLDAGYDRQDMAVFAMSDEPGWYFPAMFKALEESPTGLARFRQYLQAQGLQPGDVGAQAWDEVRPLGRSRATDLPSRRLFYWTMRFFSWDSARHFAVCTRALEEAFYPSLPVLTNWNFFSGRFYVPGPVANNADKQSQDAAMGGHDWLEFGKLRGCTMLWTEDWFGDELAYQWSCYCARLRCAARAGGVEFGGYVIPRTAGSREDGILQKILCVVGSGGKAIKYFVFGPEYCFPGNCYSENARVLRKMAEAHAMISAAEDLLWPGRRPQPEVAILMPRSAQPWDARDIPIPNQIQDATNTNLNAATVDYMAEAYDIYLALQHANIPADFLDEDALTAAGLAGYKVLYVTEPNVPEEGQHALADWVRAGGTLATVTGAAAADRYNDPCRVLSEVTGLIEQPRERMLVPSLALLPKAGLATGELGEFAAIGPRGVLVHMPNADEVRATFTDGAPAIVQRRVGQGRVVHFACMPGLSYAASSTDTRDRLPVGYSEALRRWIAYPTELAGVVPPVSLSQPLVETPMLLSAQGAAVTLLNWTGEPLQQVQVTVRVPFQVIRAESVKQGPLQFHQDQSGVKLSLDLGPADVLMLRPEAQ